MGLPRPLPTASGLDLSLACPGSRTLEQVEEPPSQAMLRGIIRHKQLQGWVEGGCAEDWRPPSDIAPVAKLPRIRKVTELAGVAEVSVWLDPVFAEAGVICIGRRPEKGEYPNLEHTFSGTIDACGLVESDGEIAMGVVEWKSRTRSDWQVRFAAAAVGILTKAETVVVREVFMPSGFTEKRIFGPVQRAEDMEGLRLHAQELLAQRSGFPPRFGAGPHCKYCKAFMSCPIQSEAIPFRPKSKKAG
jgi:hypothetical protein